MRDEPSGAALIEAARRALAEEVLPGLTGRPRYVALMVANALGIAARELHAALLPNETGGELPVGGADGDHADLVRAIRAGARDADADLHAALTRHADAAAGIWKPKQA